MFIGVGRESCEIEIHETGFSVPSDGVNMVWLSHA